MEKMKKAIGMMEILLEMQTDTYMMCKYTLLLASRERRGMDHFVRTLFGLADARRPLCIEMKEAGTV